jgi:pyruvate formate lyase activating enzyme
MALTGTIFDIKKFAIHDGPGIRTTIFFKGCPLNCIWCHNPESRNSEIERFPVRHRTDHNHACTSETEIGRRVSVDEVMVEIMQDWIFYDQSGGGVTFSGGEPLLQMDFLLALLEECRTRNIHTAVDTSGYAPREDIRRVARAADLMLYDLKLMDDDAHNLYVGVSNELILGNLRDLASTCPVIVRVPLIPDLTDTDANLDAVADFLTPLPLKRLSLLPYNKLGEDKHERYALPGHRPNWAVQDAETLHRKAARFEARGFEVSIGG